MKFAEMKKKVQKLKMYKNNNNESFEFEALVRSICLITVQL